MSYFASYMQSLAQCLAVGSWLLKKREKEWSGVEWSGVEGRGGEEREGKGREGNIKSGP